MPSELIHFTLVVALVLNSACGWVISVNVHNSRSHGGFPPMPVSFSRAQSLSSLHLKPEDAKDLIKEAELVSAKYGSTSPEAAQAWDAVEEVNASDNSAAMKRPLDEECLLDKSAACEEYANKMEELQALIGAQSDLTKR